MHLAIDIDGRPATTIGLAARRRNRSRSTTQRAIHRAVAAGDLAPLPAADLEAIGWDPRIPLYWTDEVEKALAGRPGRGANLRKTTDAVPTT